MICVTFLSGSIKRRDSGLEREADRIVRLAFGTFLGLPHPPDFMGDRNSTIYRYPQPRFTETYLLNSVIAACLVGQVVNLQAGC